MSLVDAYTPPTFDIAVDLDLSRNEGTPWALSDAPLAIDIDAVSRYPKTAALRRAIAARHGVEVDRVLVTAGGDDALARCFLARAGATVMSTAPTFEMISRYVDQTGGTLLSASWWDGDFPLDEFLAYADRASVAVIVSPNNPTGKVVNGDVLRKVAEEFSLVVLDAAYSDFADQDLTAEALRNDNVVVVRTLSKAFGLAGLRVGYLLGHSEVVEEVAGFGSPYPVSRLSACLAEEALKADGQLLRSYLDGIATRRTQLARRLSQLGAVPMPSQGNFVLATDVAPGWLVPAAASLGVGLRAFPGRPRLARSVRFTVPGTDLELERLLETLQTILAPEALLFDLDGVIADVSDSYVAAVIGTAAEFGVLLTNEDVAEAKAIGGANDDWELTSRMCRAQGIDVGLEEIMSCFQELYHGAGGREGLVQNEKPLVDADRLMNWSTRVPLAVVTGRPRVEAEGFLSRFGLGAAFSAVVAREDTSMLKPDPAPVRLAMERLGVSRAWMVGDTRDDVAAAREAGVVPIGVIAPGDPPEIARAGLSGAAVVLDSVTRIEEVLDAQKI